MPQTLYERIWNAHVIEELGDGVCLLATDRQLIYDGTSGPAFDMLRARGYPVRRPSSTLAMPDHSAPTKDRHALSGRNLKMLEKLRADAAEHGVTFFGLDDARHGIVHVVGPEQGFTLPGLVIACADSHTSTHGAFGALAFGVGSSELAHILATQTLIQRPSKPMRVELRGRPSPIISGKDLALAILRTIGAGGGIGHAIEFAGEAISALSMEGRMTLCNMAVEMGARSGVVAPDEITFAWLKGRPMAPSGEAWDEALDYWRSLPSDPGAVFAKSAAVEVGGLEPQVTWGASPDEAVAVTGVVPDPKTAPSEAAAAAWRRSLDYIGLAPGMRMQDVAIQRVFIGSCTNSRLEDLRAAAAVLKGRRVADGVRAMAVPGSGLVKRAAEAEGLDRIFQEAGFEWRDAGCSMCFGSANDSVAAGERCASTSNRNFENRQGPGARTHLVSPASAAAAAVTGRIADVRELV
ncbi:MAG: 3-isopropylmalate dehydratase large subunit [Caulobacteraceae bacterium]|nr:3-isopropylmalate dehydratase large subunit [Caulobacteraceae bacterium]